MKSLIRLLALVSVLVIFQFCHSCHQSPAFSTVENQEPKEGQVEIHYAKGFTIEVYPEYTLLKVLNPWQGAKQVIFRYLLIDKTKKLPDPLPNDVVVIRTPVKRVVCTSTTHIALLEMLDELSAVVGVSGSGLITNKRIRQKIAKGEIRDIGYDRNLNYETLVSLKPDIVMMYGVESEISGFMHKIIELGIPVVMNGEYLEKDPLAKLEWVRFIAPFFNKEKFAQARFDSVVIRYGKLKKMCEYVKERPVVMAGLPWKDVWYVSAGNTNIANYIRDAGGAYLWQDLTSGSAVPMDIETVFAKSSGAEYWINIGTVKSRMELLNTDPRFKNFKPVLKNNLFNNIGQINESGGNDYWETGLTHPQDILSDLISIFHPELLPGHPLVYYRKLN